MATLPLSLAIQSISLNISGPTESLKLISSANCLCGKNVLHNLNRVVMDRKCATRYSSFQNHRIMVFATSRTSDVEIKEKSAAYRFFTENGGQLKVFVTKKDQKYSVFIELTSLETQISKHKLVMNWGIFRSNSLELMPVDSRNSNSDATSNTIETPLVGIAKGIFVVELDFEESLAPFYLSYNLKSLVEADSRVVEIKTHRKTNFCIPIGLGRGCPAPLGLSFLENGAINFALVSRSAEKVILCLYADTNSDKPGLEIDLDPYINKSGNIWHVSMDSKLPFVSYSYKSKGRENNNCSVHVLLDPYAKIISSTLSCQNVVGKLMKEPKFDWTGDVRLSIPMEKLIVYRVNVKLFTSHKSSELSKSILGTFSGIAEKLDHVKRLGVNSILLEPIFTFDENDGPYFPTQFLSAASVYGPSSDSVAAINSLKEMVKKLHSKGIEVFLEVVFTYTAEKSSLKGIDSSSYYLSTGDKELRNKNALNCNFPIVQQMIIDSLRYWVTEFHIDGFCFINASALLKGYNGELLSRPPLVEAIAFDPILSRTKVIADMWDPHTGSSNKILFPHWKRWAEINSEFCNDVRNFLRGEGLLSDLATRLCGSGDMFLNGRGPAFSFNYIARNIGLPLVDLVSFSNKDLTSELSWNCGEEGPTSDSVVLEKRLKQIRNFLFILFISLGVPVLNMGDECGQSTGGSSLYNDRKPFDWSALKTGFGIQTTSFISYMSNLRIRRSDFLQKKSFLKVENIEWHGKGGAPPDWEDISSKFIAMNLKVDKEEGKLDQKGDLFVAFNAGNIVESIILPLAPENMIWYRLVDTSLPFPGFFVENGEPVVQQIDGLVTYEVKSHSCVLFEAKE